MRKSIDLESLIKDGEGSGAGGLCAQTSNGTAHWRSTGWNKREPWTMPELPPDPTRPAGRSNRSGE